MNDISKSRKSICIVSSQYFPHIGGVEQYVDNFARELVTLGHKVTIVTSEIEGTKEHEVEGNLEIIRLPSMPLMGGRFPVLKFNKRLRQWTRKIKTRKYDVMIVNMRFYLISLYAVRLAKKMKLRCIMLDHGTSHLNTGGKIASKMGELFEHCITWLEKRYVNEFAGVSGAVLDWIKHFHIKSDIILYNSINVEEFNEIKKNTTRDFREEYNIPKDAIVISFVGRLTIEKGIEELVKAVLKINKTRKDVYLLAAGTGYQLEKLTPIINNNIHFVGSLKKKDVVAMLETCDIFCLPSVSEGFPTTVLEASICDNFVISTYRGGTRELVKNKNYGIILPDNNWEDLCDAIMDVLDKEEYRHEAVARCKEDIEKNYTWNATAKKFVSIL